MIASPYPPRSTQSLLDPLYPTLSQRYWAWSGTICPTTSHTTPSLVATTIYLILIALISSIVVNNIFTPFPIIFKYIRFFLFHMYLDMLPCVIFLMVLYISYYSIIDEHYYFYVQSAVHGHHTASLL